MSINTLKKTSSTLPCMKVKIPQTDFPPSHQILNRKKNEKKRSSPPHTIDSSRCVMPLDERFQAQLLLADRRPPGSTGAKRKEKFYDGSSQHQSVKCC